MTSPEKEKKSSKFTFHPISQLFSFGSKKKDGEKEKPKPKPTSKPSPKPKADPKDKSVNDLGKTIGTALKTQMDKLREKISEQFDLTGNVKFENDMKEAMQKSIPAKEGIRKELNCFSIFGKGDMPYKVLMGLDKGDSCSVPKSVFEMLVRTENSSAQVLKLTNPKTKKEAWVKATSYDSSDRSIFVPTRILGLLGIAEGDRVLVDGIAVPDCTNVTFRLPKDFEKVDSKSILEYELQKHTLLYSGKVITVNIMDRTWDMVVTKTEPPGITRISNKDVKFEIVFS